MAEKIGRFDVLTLAVSKNMIKLGASLDESTAAEVERLAFDSLFDTSGAKQGVNRFIYRKKKKSPLKPKL